MSDRSCQLCGAPFGRHRVFSVPMDGRFCQTCAIQACEKLQELRTLATTENLTAEEFTAATLAIIKAGG